MRLTQKDLATRFDRDVTTINRWRAQGLLPEPATVGLRNFEWEAEDIERWEKLGTPGASTEDVEANLTALAADLDVIAACEDVHEALRKLAATAAESLRVPNLDIKLRLALGGVYVATNWFKDLDESQELRVLRARMNILGMVRDAKN